LFWPGGDQERDEGRGRQLVFFFFGRDREIFIAFCVLFLQKIFIFKNDKIISF
jgi:hypothetical protein